MPCSPHSMKFQISILLFSTVLSMLSVPAVARTVTVSFPGTTISKGLNHLEPQDSNTIRVQGTCRESVFIGDFADLTIVGIGTAGNTAAVQPIDLYCGTFSGITAAPQLATVGITNCPNSY
jgi:hypothetical protein